MRSVKIRIENMLEMKCFISLVGVTRTDRIVNEEVRISAGIKGLLEKRIYQSAEIVWTYWENE